MKKFARSNWIAAVLVALCGVLAVATLRATAQQSKNGPPATSSSNAPAADVPAPGTPPSNTPTPAAPAPATATPAGAIHDDPTVAPDKRQSADNNVSFPVDI